jgi:hypothetical protein
VTEAARVLERGVHDALNPAGKGVAQAIDKALRSVARGIEAVVERIEAVEAHLAGQLAKIGNHRARGALFSAWPSNPSTSSTAPPANNADCAAPSDSHDGALTPCDN